MYLLGEVSKNKKRQCSMGVAYLRPILPNVDQYLKYKWEKLRKINAALKKAESFLEMRYFLE
jgi:hypothetical protein